MASSAPNPSGGSSSKSIPNPPAMSCKTYIISGLKCLIYGLDELSPLAHKVTCLWLLHPRLQTQERMGPFAAKFIHNYNEARHPQDEGLIAVSFDQRNHGTREVDPRANKAWREGNESHALDMFSCYHGTSVDCSQLLDFVEGYIFPGHDDKRQITKNIVMGISLGGHAAWHVLMHDKRFDAGIVVIGCPDYEALMSDRARLSKRKSMANEQVDFVGSDDYPKGLDDAVQKYDPVGLLWKSQGTVEELRSSNKAGSDVDTSEAEQRVLPVLAETFRYKRILNLAGGSDKLVPYAIGKPFLDWLKSSTKGGFARELNIEIEDIVVPGCKHEVPPAMVEHMERWLADEFKRDRTSRPSDRDSKI